MYVCAYMCVRVFKICMLICCPNYLLMKSPVNHIFSYVSLSANSPLGQSNLMTVYACIFSGEKKNEIMK